MVTCRGCGQPKGPAEFYSSNRSTCKACVCAAVRAHRRENIAAVRAFDRRRSSLPHRVANATRVTRAWRRKHRDRMAAQNAANRAGLLSASECQGCGLPKRLEKHHPDYSKPLTVVWLCKPCHAIADKIRRAVEAA